MYYKSIIENISKRFQAKLAEIEVVYNFDHGDEFEIALCEVLQEFLPSRFGICRGFIINGNARSEGDDLIIYDKNNYSPVRALDQGDYSRKQKIPVEAVYCYIEAKNTIYLEGNDRNTLKKTLEQQNKVRDILESREKTELTGFRLSVAVASVDDGWPKYKNPPFTIIWAKNVKKDNQKNSKNLDHKQIYNILVNSSLETNAQTDLMVLGSETLGLPVKFNGNKSIYTSPFFLNDKSVNITGLEYGSSFGVAIAVLNQAFEWMQLKPIQWSKVIDDVLSSPEIT
jgi:hypothetical protein